MNVHDEQRTVAPDGRAQSEQPAWRQEFPIDVPQDNYVARRDFTQFLGLVSLAFVVGQFWILVRNWFERRKPQPPSLAIARLEDVPVGSATTFCYPDESSCCLLLRPTEKTLLAYDQKCTHLSCAVIPALERGQLLCPCHKGVFDVATGRPIAGPPRRPLPVIHLEVREGVIYAEGVETRTV